MIGLGFQQRRNGFMMHGRGHIVLIRWYLPNDSYGLEQICKFADKLENRYKTIMEEIGL